MSVRNEPRSKLLIASVVPESDELDVEDDDDEEVGVAIGARTPAMCFPLRREERLSVFLLCSFLGEPPQRSFVELRFG
jgi:hypothetical protein